MATLGNLYSKNILVRLTNSKSSEEKFKPIHITVDYQITGTLQSHKTELIIKLTDENDPFFLYSLYMTEEDYQTLKLQQGLLVDFGAFGQRFIDLLCACEKDEKSENPKFQLQLFSKEPLPYDHSNANLNVIEINPFKHLVHLSLCFMPGNDTDVKKYLANCLKTLRDEYSKLSRLFEETKFQLNQKLDSTQQQLNQKSNELDKLKVDLDSQSERLIAKHMQELNFERDKSMQNQYATQQKYEKEKKELELNLMKTIKQLEQRLNEFEMNNKDLLEKKYKFESQLQELKIKHGSLQDEYNSIKLELTTTRKENSNLNSDLHSNEIILNQLKTRIAVLEQELKDKLESMNKSQELFANEQNQRKQLDDLLKEKTNELKKKQAEINHYVQEFKKGNEVVTKLQNSQKHLASQVKLKSTILTEQEKVMKEKEKQIESLTSELKELNRKLDSINEENKDLKNMVQKKTSELEEAAKLLKRDENIINWLNKQITDNSIGLNTQNKLAGGFESGNSVQFRPYGALINPNLNFSTTTNLTTSSTNSINALNQTEPSTLRPSSTLNQYYNKTNTTNPDMDSNRRYLMSAQNSYQQRAALSSGSSSSIQQNDTLKENQDVESPTLNHRQIELNKIGIGSTKLDPKYFQNHSPQSLTSSGNYLDTFSLKQQQNSTSSTNGQIQTATTGNGTSVRINKQLVTQPISNTTGTTGNQQHQQQMNPNISSKSTPSLASAYFPSAN